MSAQVVFNCNAGALVRGQLRRAVKQYAWEHGYELEVEEDKGLFESLFRFTLDVPDNQGKQAYADIAAWIKEIKS